MKRTEITAILPDIDAEKLDKIMDLNGADVNRMKAEMEQLRGQLTAAQSELAGLKAKGDNGAELQALKDELTSLKTANALRDLREKVSKESGVPASLLTADTEDACKAQAEAIKAYAQPTGYPAVRDGGEVHATGGKPATRDQFAEYVNKIMS